MIFVFLTFLSAFFIEAIGTYTSIIGLSLLFSSNPVIIAMALALDMGKLITVSFLYKHWKKMHAIMKTYMLVAAAILMVITSAGAAGYLSAEFSNAILNTKESDIRVTALKDEKVKLETRKKEIDSQIANLPPNMVKGRTKLINEFKTEISRVNDRIVEIDKALPDLEVAKAGTEAHAGPILYIAKAFNITVEEAVKWVILLIIFVFDPLAIVLIIGGNFLVDQRKIEQKEIEREKKEAEEEERQRRYHIEMEELKHKHEVEGEKVEIEKLHVPVCVPAQGVTPDDLNELLIARDKAISEELETVTHTVDQFEDVPEEELKHLFTHAFSEAVELEQPHVKETPIDDAGEVFIPHEETEVFECVQPVPEEETKGTKIETLPDFPEVEEDPEPTPLIETEQQLEEVLDKEHAILIDTTGDGIPDFLVERVENPDGIIYKSTAFDDVDSSNSDVTIIEDPNWRHVRDTKALKMYRTDFTS